MGNLACSGSDSKKTTLDDCRCRLNFHSLCCIYTGSGCPINSYSTSKCLLGTCPLFTVCQPLLLLLLLLQHQSQTNPAAETFNLPLSVCLPGRHLHSQQPQLIQRATGMFIQRAPTQSDLFTGRGRFKGKLGKVRL